MEMFEDLYIPVSHGLQSYTYSVSSTNCPNDQISGIFPLHERTASSFFFTGIDSLEVEMFEDNPEKSRRGWPFITVLANLRSETAKVRFVENGNVRYEELGNFTNQVDVPAGWYYVFVDDLELESNKELRLGGVYTVIISQSAATAQSKLFLITQPNSVSMLWLIPQYVVVTLGEVMFSITGLEFSFTQAPVSMKSVIQGCWLLTVAFGNLIVVIITGANFFESQTYEFFLFAGLMFLDMIVFSWLAVRYKPIPLDLLKDLEDEEYKEEKPSALEFKQEEKDQ